MLRRPAVILGTVVVLVAGIVSGCGKGGGDEEGSALKGGRLRMGAALSLTGSLAKEGALTKQGYQLCQEKVNARGGVKVGDQKAKLAIIYSDDRSQPDTAAQLVDKFNDRGQNVTKPMSAIQIQGGKVVTIYPKEQQEAPLQWPAK